MDAPFRGLGTLGGVVLEPSVELVEARAQESTTLLDRGDPACQLGALGGDLRGVGVETLARCVELLRTFAGISLIGLRGRQRSPQLGLAPTRHVDAVADLGEAAA